MADSLALLKRKVLGVPAWVIGLGAIALLAFYLWRKRQAAAAAAAAATTAGSSVAGNIAGAAASDNGLGYGSVGYLGGYSPPSQLPVPVTTTPTPQPSPAPTPVTTPGQPSQTVQGSGYWLGPVATPIHGTDGNWYQWESPAVAAAFPTAQRYIQIEPGYFVPMTSSTKLAPGTPQFLRTAPPVPGYNYSGSIPAPGAPGAPTGVAASPGALTAG